MASSYKGIDLFGSGPHRFALGPEGNLVVSNLALGVPAAGSVSLGRIELDVFVTGRLVAATESALWTLRDAITGQFAQPPTTGTLVDHAGRAWTDMAFIRFEAGDRTDRGRVISLGYRAVFRKFVGTGVPSGGG